MMRNTPPTTQLEIAVMYICGRWLRTDTSRSVTVPLRRSRRTGMATRAIDAHNTPSERVLMSFAEFELEMSSERTRDKDQ
ncbi:MAG: hypothetical protein IPK13_02740 [Deltaproteobacteria bacterium]|nr:hypothetical protein [Deltaproteobacteria bacterium]